MNRVHTGRFESNSRTFQGLLKDFYTVFQGLKFMKNTDLSVKILTEIMEKLVVEN